MKKFRKSTDEPINRTKDDRFGRVQFSNALAEALIKVPKNQSMTVGLYGQWGSGKTSIINMATEHLETKYSETCVVVNFNPWIYSNAESLHQAFFVTLAATLGKSIKTDGQKIAGELKTYGELTSSVGSLAALLQPQWAVPLKLVGSAGSKLLKAFGGKHSGEGQDINQTRDRVNNLLEKSEKRVVVVIDDIDRLDGDEIHQVFRLVKNVAHFSNISYLLSFDREVVKQVLSKRYPENPKVGGDFIDKIVQLPLYVPSAESELILSYLNEEVNRIIESKRLVVNDEDTSRFQTIFYSREAWKLFTTPRKVIRYLNTLDFSLERLGGEVSFADVAAIDLLRIFYPNLYETLPELRNTVLRTGSHRDRGDTDKEEVRRLIFGDVEPSGYEVMVIRELFPSVEWALGGSAYGDGFEAGWEETKRVCTEKYFNRYFSYGIPIGDIPDSRIEQYIERLDSDKITEKEADRLFRILIKNADAKLIISKLRRKEKKLPEIQSVNLAKALISSGPELPKTRASILGDVMSPYVQSAILAVQLLQRTSSPFDVLNNAFKVTRIDYAAELLRWTRVNSDNDKNEADFVPMLSAADIDRLGAQLANRIKGYSRSHDIQKDFPDDTPHLMWIWDRWGNKVDIKAYYKKRFADDNQLAVDFLMTYTSKAYSLETGQRVPSDFRADQYKSIADVVNPTILVSPLKKVFGNDVDKATKYPDADERDGKSYEYIVASQFLYIHKNQSKPKPTKREEDAVEGEVVEAKN